MDRLSYSIVTSTVPGVHPIFLLFKTLVRELTGHVIGIQWQGMHVTFRVEQRSIQETQAEGRVTFLAVGFQDVGMRAEHMQTAHAGMKKNPKHPTPPPQKTLKAPLAL